MRKVKSVCRRYKILHTPLENSTSCRFDVFRARARSASLVFARLLAPPTALSPFKFFLLRSCLAFRIARRCAREKLRWKDRAPTAVTYKSKKYVLRHGADPSRDVGLRELSPASGPPTFRSHIFGLEHDLTSLSLARRLI